MHFVHVPACKAVSKGSVFKVKQICKKILSFFPPSKTNFSYILSRVIPNRYVLGRSTVCVCVFFFKGEFHPIFSEPIKLTLAFTLQWGKYYSVFQKRCISNANQTKCITCHARRFACYPSAGNVELVYKSYKSQGCVIILADIFPYSMTTESVTI